MVVDVGLVSVVWFPSGRSIRMPSQSGVVWVAVAWGVGCAAKSWISSATSAGRWTLTECPATRPSACEVFTCDRNALILDAPKRLTIHDIDEINLPASTVTKWCTVRRR